MGRRRWWVAGIGTLAIAAGAGAYALLALDVVARGGGTLTGPEGAAFRVEYPEGWSPDSGAELAAFTDPPLAVLRHDEGRGVIVIRLEARFAGNLQEFADDLEQELDDRLPDFRPVGARVVRIAAGSAFSYSYVRELRATAHSIIIVPAGNRSYVLDTVVAGGADDVAREAGRIVDSFSLSQD